jgi:hypothetical protein
MKKYKVGLPILTESVAVFELDAANKRQAIKYAEDLWAVHCDRITKGNVDQGERLELEPGATAVAYQYENQQVGRDVGGVYVCSLEEEAAAEAAAAMEDDEPVPQWQLLEPLSLLKH